MFLCIALSEPDFILIASRLTEEVNMIDLNITATGGLTDTTSIEIGRKTHD